MLDFILLAVIAVVTWMVASDGPWSAAITLVSVLIAGLVAMNLFEPLAAFLSNSLPSYPWQNRWDVICLLGVFAGGVFGLRALGEYLLPTYAVVNTLMYELMRWGLGLVNGYVVAAIFLTALHTAPLPREFLDFTPERKNLFGLAPDIQWLGFTQYVSEHSMRRMVNGQPVIFDGMMSPANPAKPQSLEVWSSFPLRYAARRQQYMSGGNAPVATGPGVPAPQPQRPASPGAGGRGSGTGGF